MDVDDFAHPSVNRWQYHRVTVPNKPEVADQSLVEDLVDYGAIVGALLRQATQPGSF